MSVKSSSSGVGDAELDDMNTDGLTEESFTAERKEKKKAAPNDSSEQPSQTGKSSRVKVKKVSPCVKFFCSIRIFVLLVMLIFAILFCVIVGMTSLNEIRKVYADMDSFDMKERIQDAIHGIIQGSIAMIFRTSFLSSDFWYFPYFSDEVMSNFSETERVLSSIIYHSERVIVESSGLTEYDNLPFHLIMAWDDQWNERLAYYRPCRDPKNRTLCDLLDPSETFADVENNDFTLIHKDKIPKFFRDLNKVKPYCVTDGTNNCTGIANIPFDEGGPMFFSAFNIGDVVPVVGAVFRNWTFLVASNALLVNQIQANRTGLCSSLYSSTEEHLSSYMADQFKNSKEKHLTLNPTDFDIDLATFTSVISVNSTSVTLEQDYLAEKMGSYVEIQSDRAVCDAYYDHTVENFGLMESTCAVYKTFDFKKGHTDDETIAFRFEYHAPVTNRLMVSANMLVILLCVLFVVINICVFLYFNCVFLIPLDHLRVMRAQLIKSILSGFEDDAMMKDLFGDVIDDSTLIEANGDEITVMLTLQDRMDALYSNIINSKIEEVNQARSVTRNELCALRLMNLFMRRDDEGLRAILPGLLDPDEINRYRRTNIVLHAADDGGMLNKIAIAKRAFRSLKAVLNNTISTQFFKAFCIQRGRVSVNSFFFLMDVSWLHQVESGENNDQDDFLFAMFSDSVAPSPGMTPVLGVSKSMSGRFSPSGSLLTTPESSTLDLHSQPDPDRPHHSHFAKSKGSGVSNSSSPSSVSQSPAPEPSVQEEEAKSPPRTPRMPVAKNSNSPSAAPLRPTNETQFSSKISDGIAHFIHESYFGAKSIAKRDLRHAALLGCSHVPDYLQMRDNKDIVFHPAMFDNLVTAVTKKFTAEVLPQFHNSVSFQVMVYALAITGFFDEDQHKDSAPKEEDGQAKEKMPLLKGDNLLKGLWEACSNSNGGKDKKKEDVESSSDSDSEDSDNDPDDNPKKDDKPSEPTSEAEE